MEILIPSLSLILLTVAFIFFTFPRLAPTVLVGGSVAVLAIAIYMHYSRFGTMEYEKATWYYSLRKYASFVMVGIILLGAYGFWAMNQQSTPFESAISSPAMPAVSFPSVGGGMDVVVKTASSRIKELMRHGRISTN